MADQKTNEPSDNAKAAQGCLMLIGIIGAIVAVFYIGSGPGGSSSGSAGGASSRPEITLPNGEQVDSVEAVVMCENRARDQLRAPSTASFVGPFSGDYREPRKVGNAWRHFVLVDAENALGGTVRTTFYCEINGDTNEIIVEAQAP